MQIQCSLAETSLRMTTHMDEIRVEECRTNGEDGDTAEPWTKVTREDLIIRQQEDPVL